MPSANNTSNQVHNPDQLAPTTPLTQREMWCELWEYLAHRPTIINVFAYCFWSSLIVSYLHCDIFVNHLGEKLKPFVPVCKRETWLTAWQRFRHIYSFYLFFKSASLLHTDPNIESVIFLACVSVYRICVSKLGTCSHTFLTTYVNKGALT